jgi:predicted DNA-binding protein
LASTTNENISTNQNSLAAQLAQPSRKKSTIRFTLDLEKSLDKRLTQSAARLNRSKADLVRIAVNRLLEELEA